MTNTELKEIFKVAFVFLNINIPNNLDVQFEQMSGKEAYFRMNNINWYYFRFNDIWNKSSYTLYELSMMLAIAVHEVRHYWQLCVTNNPTFIIEFIGRNNSSEHLADWISLLCEKDAEALRFIFMCEVLKYYEDVYKLVGIYNYPKKDRRRIRKIIHEEKIKHSYDVVNAVTTIRNLFSFFKSSSISIVK